MAPGAYLTLRFDTVIFGIEPALLTAGVLEAAALLKTSSVLATVSARETA